jgi:hypothetical protein
MLKFQPSNSPVCNVKDDCVFPALSKHVSRQQGILKGSQVHAPDELWTAATKRWCEFPLDTLARACVCHGQIASAIAHCQGGDDFMRERNGLRCGVRNCCVTVCNEEGKPTGVEVVQAHEEDEDVAGRQLEHNPPDVEPTPDENLKRMTPAELQCLFEGLPADHEWFDAATDAHSVLDPSDNEWLSAGPGRRCEVKHQAMHPLKESSLLVGLAHLCLASSVQPWILCASDGFDANAANVLFAVGFSAQNSSSRRIVGKIVASRSSHSQNGGYPILGIGWEPTQSNGSCHLKMNAGQTGDWTRHTLQNGIGFTDVLNHKRECLGPFARFRFSCTARKKEIHE